MTAKKLITTCIFIFISTIAHAQLDEWRGPGRTGVYSETGLLKSWPNGGPKLLWELDDLGEGYGSVTISGNTIYITGRKGDDDVLTAMTMNGKKKWETIYGEAWTRNHEGTRGIPTVYKGNIFLVSGRGELVSVSPSGKINWKRNHYQMYGGRALMFGVSESPIVHDDKVIVSPGRNKAAMVAFDTNDGKVIWEAKSLEDPPQYVNPLLVNHNGRNLIVTLSNNYIFGVDADTGKHLWKLDYEEINDSDSFFSLTNHTNTPLYRNGRVFVANGYKYTSVMIELSRDGSKAEVAWTNPDIGPHHGGMLVLGDYIYGTSYKSNSMGNWVCVRWRDGKTMWSTRWHNKGSIIAADNMLYIYEERSGNVGLLKANPKKFDLVSSFRITKGDGPHWAHPVIHDGKLYIRHGEILMVYSIKK